MSYYTGIILHNREGGRFNENKMRTISVCVTMTFIMAMSAFGGMDTTENINNIEIKDIQVVYEILSMGYVCDCGHEMKRTEYQMAPWTFAKMTDCQHGYGGVMTKCKKKEAQKSGFVQIAPENIH